MRISPDLGHGIGERTGDEIAWEQPQALLRQLETHARIAFQPLVSIHTGATYGYEALLRGHEAFGEVSPSALVSRLFDGAVAVEADALVRRKSIEGFAGFAAGTGARLFFNVDDRLIDLPGYNPAETVGLLRQHGLSSAMFCAELAEGRAVADAGRVARLLRQTIPACQLVIDDFGTGQSGLLLLHEIRPELIKLDRFFISGVDTSQTKRVLLAAIVSLAHVLGISVVAEGVENEAEFMVCREVGCDMAQGHFIAHPIDGADMMARRYEVVSEANQRDRRARGDDARTIRALLDTGAPLPADASLADVLAVFRDSQDRAAVAVVDRYGEPIGVIEEAAIKPFVYARGASDAGAGLAPGGFRLFDHLTRCMIADIGTPIDTILAGQAAREWDPCVLITEAGRHAGALSREAMLRILNQRRLLAAQNQNPLTRLPGNISIADWITEATATSSQAALIYVDFDNFKAFNDEFGFRQGDRAIMLFVDLMRTQFATAECFLGHVGGDDFFIGLHGVGPDAATARSAALLAGFAAGAASFYPPEARRRGAMEITDREGNRRLVPLLCASAAIVALPACGHGDEGPRNVTLDTISAELAALKRAAKRSAGKISTLVLDR